MKKYQVNPIDVRILKELTTDARISFVQLSKKIKISNTLVHKRIKIMKEAGLLKNATYEIDAWSLGYETAAFTQIVLTDAKHHRRVENELFKIVEIVECINIAGRYALLVKIYAKNNRHLRDVIYEKIQPIEGVEATNTTFLFETAFRRSLPLEN